MAAAGSLLVVVVSVWLMGMPTGLAQPDGSGDRAEATAEEKKQFSQFVEAGKQAYSKGEFEKAVPFFEQAYEIIAVPELHYRLALSHERAGHPKEAITHYRAFLEAKPETSKKGAIEQTIARLQKETKAVVRVESTPSNARVFVQPAGADKPESEARGETPIELTVEPGDLEIVLEKDGYEARRESLEAEAGSRYQFAWELAETDAPSGRSRAGSAGPGTLPIVAAIVGGIGAISYGAFYGVGKHCQNNRPDCTSGLYTTSVIGSYSGAVLAIAGATTAALTWKTADARRAGGSGHRDGPAVQITLSPLGVGLSGRF